MDEKLVVSKIPIKTHEVFSDIKRILSHYSDTFLLDSFIQFRVSKGSILALEMYTIR